MAYLEPCPYCTINQDEMQLSMSMRVKAAHCNHFMTITNVSWILVGMQKRSRNFTTAYPNSFLMFRYHK